MERLSVRSTPAPMRTYRRRFAVLCPACGARICDISPNSRMEQFLQDDEERPSRAPDVFVKCAGCKTELYLYKITE